MKILKIKLEILNRVWEIGDWGLGIGDWAQSPIPIPNPLLKSIKINFIFLKRFLTFFFDFLKIK
jgi:hypothetical protein